MNAIVAFVVYAAISAAYTWPLLHDFGSRLPSDPADPLFNASILLWNATTPLFSAGWWDAPHYFPAEGVSAFTEHLAGISLLASPVVWIGGNPILAHNVAYFLTWPLSGIAMFLLVERLTARPDAAFLAGLAFAFTPYRTTEIAHVQSLSSYWMPLALLGLHAFLTTRQRLWLAVFAVAWLLQSLANGYYMLFGAVFIAMWVFYFCSRRTTWQAGVAVLGTWIVASLPLLPILLKYVSIHARLGFTRSLNEILAYSARPHAWLEVSGDVWLWRGLLPQGKDDLFPGVTALALVAAGAVVMTARHRRAEVDARFVWLRRLLVLVAASSLTALVAGLAFGPWDLTVAGFRLRMTTLDRAIAALLCALASSIALSPSWRRALGQRSPSIFYASAVVVIAVFCCGPVLHAGDAAMWSPAPYAWLMALPGFNELRVPPRFWMFGVMSLSVAAGLTYAAIRPARGLWASTAFVAVAAALLADGWMPTMRMAAPPELSIAVESGERTGTILELPLGPEWDFSATYRAARHHRRVVNGVSGYDPPHYAALRAGLQDRDPATLAALTTLGALDVVVDHAFDPDGAIERYVAGMPGALRGAGDSQRVLFLLPKTAMAPPLGPPLPIARIEAVRFSELFSRHGEDVPALHDDDMTTTWTDNPQQAGQWIVVDLGRPMLVAGVSHALGPYFLAYPQRLAIEASLDANAWEQVWEGPTTAEAFLGLVKAPLQGIQGFRFPARPARYVRLLQTASASREWRVAEIRVHGPS